MPISRTVPSLMPLVIRTIIKCKVANRAAIHTKGLIKNKTAIIISKIPVPIITSLIGRGNKFAAQGNIYPPQVSGDCKIKIPIQQKVIASPILKMYDEVLFIEMSGRGVGYYTARYFSISLRSI